MDAWTAIIIGVGGSLIVVLISQIQNRRTRDDRVAALDQTAGEVAVSGRRHFIKTGMAAELFPSLFRFIPV